MITLENVGKKFDTFVIKNVNLKINQGEYFVILGPSGSGKTLLLEMIAGLIKPDSGRIKGVNSAKIGLIYQDYMLFPHLNVYQNIAYGLKIKKETKEQIKSKVEAVINQLEISDLVNRSVQSLSGGEKQRVAIARAMVINPDIYLLDEPTAALDLSTKIKIQRLFMQLHKNKKATIIHVTHDFDEALALGDRIALLIGGKISQTDKPENVFNQPANKAAADFLGYKNVFSGKIEENLLGINGIKIVTPLKQADSAHIAIRSNDILISNEKIILYPSSARNVFQGEVAGILNRTNHVEILIDIGVTLHVDITLMSCQEMGLTAGNKVWVTFKTTSVKVFKH